MTSEQLFTCPRCGTPNFTHRGLVQHVAHCKRSMSTSATNLEVVSNVPAVQVPDALAQRWDAARRYVDAASLFQKASLAAQVMAGFELTALHKAYGIKHGGDRRGSSFHDERLIWKEALSKHLGVSETTAWRWMEMAKAAKPRLGKGDLQLGEILAKNPSALTPAEQELLTKAVKKITDGRTQLEFMLELGVAKTPQGAGAKGGNTRGKDVAGEQDPAAPILSETEAQLQLRKQEAEYLRDLLISMLEKRPWNALDEMGRKELHGLLTDASALVKATL